MDRRFEIQKEMLFNKSRYVYIYSFMYLFVPVSSASNVSCVPETAASLARIFQGCCEAVANLDVVSLCVGHEAFPNDVALQPSKKSHSLSLWANLLQSQPNKNECVCA